MDYTGVIIEESLALTGVLKGLQIVETRIEEVTDLHRTPWLQQWTLHTVRVPHDKAGQVAFYLSRSFDPANPFWYADFKNDRTHYIIYPDKVFKINRSSAEDYRLAAEYGIGLGIPDYQIAFAPASPGRQIF